MYEHIGPGNEHHHHNWHTTVCGDATLRYYYRIILAFHAQFNFTDAMNSTAECMSTTTTTHFALLHRWVGRYEGGHSSRITRRYLHTKGTRRSFACSSGSKSLHACQTAITEYFRLSQQGLFNSFAAQPWRIRECRENNNQVAFQPSSLSPPFFGFCHYDMLAFPLLPLAVTSFSYP